jgi:hypothetical protein
LRPDVQYVADDIQLGIRVPAQDDRVGQRGHGANSQTEDRRESNAGGAYAKIEMLHVLGSGIGSNPRHETSEEDSLSHVSDVLDDIGADTV